MVNIQHLKFGYSKHRMLFNDVTLGLEKGRVYGLLGKNGAGKTTLLKIICGLLFPKEGQCNVFGEEPGKRMPSILEDIYIVPEEFILPTVSIRSYVKAYAGFYSKFSHQEMERLISEFGLTMDHKLHALSYGQKKKFLIAFGLATNASILVFDEPTNGLDIPSKVQFRRIVASSLNGERSLIISTHQVRDLESILDSIIILDNGDIVFNYPVEKIGEKLAFNILREEPEKGSVLYSEDILGGKMAIMENKNPENETKIELEILFNGILSNPQMFNQIIQRS